MDGLGTLAFDAEAVPGGRRRSEAGRGERSEIRRPARSEAARDPPMLVAPPVLSPSVRGWPTGAEHLLGAAEPHPRHATGEACDGRMSRARSLRASRAAHPGRSVEVMPGPQLRHDRSSSRLHRKMDRAGTFGCPCRPPDPVVAKRTAGPSDHGRRVQHAPRSAVVELDPFGYAMHRSGWPPLYVIMSAYACTSIGCLERIAAQLGRRGTGC
jgi:hypothetical protein